MSLFTVKFQLNIEGGRAVNVDYDRIDDCRTDVGVEAWFAASHVEKCEIYCGATLITRLPEVEDLMTFQRLKDQLESNSAHIYAARGKR